MHPARYCLLGCAGLFYLACTPTTPPPDPTPEPSFCDRQGWSERAFDSMGPFGILRRDLAADFTVPTTTGDWHLAEQFTGCESYVFVPDNLYVSPLDPTPLVNSAEDLAELIEKSPRNTHYFFVSMSQDSGRVDTLVSGMTERIEQVLSELSGAQRNWWSERLHVIDTSALRLRDWVRDSMTSTGSGFAIDRFQRIRGFGGLADVTRFDQGLDNAGAWPWRANLSYLANEVRYYNYESDRDDMLAEHDWTVVTLWDNERFGGNAYTSVTLPDPATMAGFDTMLVDATYNCRQDQQELGNCGPWDYRSAFYLCDVEDPDSCNTELARYITTYHREARWIPDASHMLVHLKGGGERRFRFDPSSQSYDMTVRILLSNRGKGSAPYAADYLWAGGGGFGSGYDANHPPIEVDVPADAQRVYLYANITGHGQGGNYNCAEFCAHQHDFAVDGPGGTQTFSADHPMVGDNLGCVDQIDIGTVPNQNGTWWFGRGGWCPGKQVDPWVWDVSDLVTAGQPATFSYTTNGGLPYEGGNIWMHSWLVYWK